MDIHQDMQEQKQINSNYAQFSFVGRQNEFDILMETGEIVFAGLGRMCLILGEPGIGKSRLISEWKNSFQSTHSANSFNLVEIQSSTGDREVAYHLLKALFNTVIKIIEPRQQTASPSAIHSALVEKHALITEHQAQYLAYLLDRDFPPENEKIIQQLSARDLQTQYKHILHKLLSFITEICPTIILIDDLQWTDHSSIQLLVELLPALFKKPIFFIAASRQEKNSNGWQLISVARESLEHQLIEIFLQPFSNIESKTFISQLPDFDEMPVDFTQNIAEKSEGNPLFLEELARVIIDQSKVNKINAIKPDNQTFDLQKIPESLQSLLFTRIDQLDHDAQFTLQTASIIGRRFSSNLLKSILKRQNPTLNSLEELDKIEAAGMVQIESANPELIYKFRHVLLHQAVYQKTIESNRSKLHQLAAEQIEIIYHDQIEKYAPELAEHYLRAVLPKKSGYFFQIAGEIALRAYASLEAEAFFEQALMMIKDQTQLASLYVNLGIAQANQSKHSDAVKSWRKALPLFQSLGNTDRVAWLYAKLARSIWAGINLEEHRQKSLAICFEGLKAIEGATASPDVAALIHETGRSLAFNMKHFEAKDYALQALSMAENLNAYEVQAEALATIGILMTTEPPEGIKLIERSIKISEENQLYGSTARGYNNLSALIQYYGDFRKAKDYRIKALAMAEKSSSSINSFILKQEIISSLLWLGELEDVDTSISEIKNQFQEGTYPSDRNWLNMLMLEGVYYRFTADFNSASTHFINLIENSRLVDDSARVLEGMRSQVDIQIEPYFLGQDFSFDGNYNNLINQFLQELKIGENLPNQTIAAIYCQICLINIITNDLNAAEEALNKAQSNLEKIINFIHHLWQTSKVTFPHTIMLLQRPFMEWQKITEARLEVAKRNFDKAISLFQESIQGFIKTKSKWWEARIKLELGSAYLLRGEPEDLESAQSIFREARITFDEMKIDYYANIAIDKLRQVKRASREQAVAHKNLTLELVEGGRIQHSFIPAASPDLAGYQISGVLLSAREMSGDFYDYYNLDKNMFGVVIADVADKGAGAALYMAMSRTLLRTYAVEGKLPPEQAFHEANRRLLSDIPNGIFLTAVYGILNLNTGNFTYVNAGHNPPIFLSKKQNSIQIKILHKTGPLLGIFADSTWKVEEIIFEPGDTLVFYTDGITEAQNQSGAYYGQDHFLSSLLKYNHLSAEDYRNAVIQDILEFTGNRTQLDDITLTILKKA